MKKKLFDAFARISKLKELQGLLLDSASFEDLEQPGCRLVARYLILGPVYMEAGIKMIGEVTRRDGLCG